MDKNIKPKAVVLTSNKPRHFHYALSVSKSFDLIGALFVEKKAYYDQQISSSKLIEQHFIRLEQEETKYFRNENVPSNCEFRALNSQQSINELKWVDWAKKLNPDLLFLFGTEILKGPWLEAFPDKIINLHLGLSPFYRGSGTLFWPFYFSELQYVGVTIHIAAAKVDAGHILGYALPDLEIGDNFYSINLKAIAKGIEVAPQLGLQFLQGARVPANQNPDCGRLFRKVDFTEEALAQALAAIAPVGLDSTTISLITQKRRELGLPGMKVNG